MTFILVFSIGKWKR